MRRRRALVLRDATLNIVEFRYSALRLYCRLHAVQGKHGDELTLCFALIFCSEIR